MKNLFLTFLLMFTVISLTTASNGNPKVSHTNGDSEELIIATKYTVNGKNEGNTITTETNSDGSSTTTVKVDCDSEVDLVCYTVELSPAGLTEVSPSEGKSVKGLLISSNAQSHMYKLKSTK